MLRRFFVVFFLALAWAIPASAGYAQLAPPPAFQSIGGVSTMSVGTAANGARYAGGHVVANASLNLGARVVTVPVAMRVAANAATFAVTKLNPWIAGLQLAAVAIPFIVDWFSDFNENSESTLSVDSNGKIVKTGKIGFQESSPGFPGFDMGGIDIHVTKLNNGLSIADAFRSNYGLISSTSYCRTMWSPGPDGQNIIVWAIFAEVSTDMTNCKPSGVRVDVSTCESYINSYGETGMRRGKDWAFCPGSGGVAYVQPSSQVTQADLDLLSQFAINPKLLAALGLPLPVDPQPVVNPVSEPVGDFEVGPDVNPAPQLQPNPDPLRYPDGSPVPIPNTNPQVYTQPWFEVSPAPTVSEPWRVIIRPVVTETLDPTPQNDPDGSTPKVEPPFDFYTDCDKYPGVISCAGVGSAPDSVDLPKQTKEFVLQNGPAFSGSGCPSNLDISFAGKGFQIVDMSVPCGWLSGLVKPIFILLSFISAVFIVRKAL